MFQSNMTQSARQISDALGRLRLFNEKAHELQSYSFMKKSSDRNAGVTFSLDLERGTATAERVGADNEARAAMCLVLRFFVQTRDKIALRQIEKLYRELPLPRPHQHEYWITENLISLKHFLDGKDGNFVTIHGKRITYGTVLETFLYGDQAHANEDKRSLYAAWKQNEPIHLLLESMFEEAACATIQYVVWLAKVNEETIKTLEAIHLAEANSLVP